MEKQNEGLQLEDDIEFLRKDWKFERIGWVFLTLFVLAAAAGLFGRGGFIWNKAVAGNSEDGLALEYNPFWRQQSPEELKITMSGADTSIVFSSTGLDDIKIENVLPQPEHLDHSENKLTVTYKNSAEARVIKVFLDPQKIGPFKCRVTTGNKPAANLSVFIYP